LTNISLVTFLVASVSGSLMNTFSRNRHCVLFSVLVMRLGTKAGSKNNWEHACLRRDHGCTRWWGGKTCYA